MNTFSAVILTVLALLFSNPFYANAAESTKQSTAPSKGSTASFDNSKFSDSTKVSDADQCSSIFTSTCERAECLHQRMLYWSKKFKNRLEYLQKVATGENRVRFAAYVVRATTDHNNFVDEVRKKYPNMNDCAQKFEFLKLTVPSLKKMFIGLNSMPAS